MKTRDVLALLLIPVTIIGSGVGFVAEMFMVGFRAGQEIVERIVADGERERERRRKGKPNV